MGDIATLVSGIEYRVRKLIAQNQSLHTACEQFKNENQLLIQTIDKQKEIIKTTEDRINLLKLAKTLETKEGNVEAKLKINELVREIDKCIGLLNT